MSYINFLYFILGVLITWFVTWFYYKRTSKEQNRSFGKVFEEFKKEAIKKIKEEFKNSDKITEILNEFWVDIKNKHGEEFVKSRCPRCTSDQIETAWIMYGEDQEGSITFCAECGYEFS